MDGNARLGSITTQAIGDHGAEDEDEPGELLHGHLLDHSMVLPATMPGLHTGPTATWTAPSATVTAHRTRNDYIAIPRDWLPGVTSSVNFFPETLAKLADHDAVKLKVRLTSAKCDTPSFFRRKRICCTAHFADDDKAQQFEAHLAGFTQPSWDTDVHVHERLVVNHVRDGLAAASPRCSVMRHASHGSPTRPGKPSSSGRPPRS